MIVRDTYAWASPYGNANPARLYGGRCRDLYGRPMKSAAEFEKHLATLEEWPEIVLLGNFSRDRDAMAELCRERGINVVHWEDGFFPHYETQHADPLGFCWESSLPRLVFRTCSERQRHRARAAREAWLERPGKGLPAGLRQPFILWPLQLIGDQVNARDLNVRDWTELLRHFRANLPADFQFVLKAHPRATARDTVGLDPLLRELPNTLLVPSGTDLSTLLRACHAVAGVNSSVLTEARLMHHKPVYAYGRSWFTGHDALVFPLPRPPAPAGFLSPRDFECLENPSLIRTEYLDDYADWFLAQLLARQIDPRSLAGIDQPKAAVWRLSYRSFLEHGEAIFEF